MLESGVTGWLVATCFLVLMVVVAGRLLRAHYYGLGPTTIRSLSAGSLGSNLGKTTTWPLSAVHSAAYRGEPEHARTVTPRTAAPISIMLGCPEEDAGIGNGPIAIHPATDNPLWRTEARSYASPSSAWYRISAVPFGCFSNAPTNRSNPNVSPPRGAWNRRVATNACSEVDKRINVAARSFSSSPARCCAIAARSPASADVWFAPAMRDSASLDLSVSSAILSFFSIESAADWRSFSRFICSSIDTSRFENLIALNWAMTLNPPIKIAITNDHRYRVLHRSTFPATAFFSRIKESMWAFCDNSWGVIFLAVAVSFAGFGSAVAAYKATKEISISARSRRQ